MDDYKYLIQQKHGHDWVTLNGQFPNLYHAQYNIRERNDSYVYRIVRSDTYEKVG